MSNEILDELNAVFVSPELQFKGKEIAPYTEGSRLLMLQVRDENDSSVWFVWAFLYLHILLKNNRKEAIKLAWNKDKFRESLLEWVSQWNEKDRDEATELVGKIIQDSAKSRVEVISQGTSEGELGKA